MDINRPNQVWATDITYVPMPKASLFRVAIADRRSHRVLTWRRSNTVDAHFCVEALKGALHGLGRPDTFNTGQGGQFISLEFTGPACGERHSHRHGC